MSEGLILRRFSLFSSMSTLSTTSRRAGASRTDPNRDRIDLPGVAPVARRSPKAPQMELPEPGVVRPFLRRWVTAAMLLAGAVLATLYISNAIAVNDLLASIASLEHDRDVARGENEKLRAELLKLMAVERVTSIASGQLGMVQPIQPPQSILPDARSEASARDSATVR